MSTKTVLCLALLTFVGLARASTPALPNIPAYTTSVTQAPYNAQGDGTTDNTTAIQNAINDMNARGGGMVQIPGPGVYLTGPLTMKNKINLQIGAGATLRMKPYGSWPGTSPLLSFPSLANVELSGLGGIDGQGAGWWPTSAGSGLYMIYFNNCNTVLVHNVTVSNAPKQQIVFKGRCGNITLQDVTIRAPSSSAAFPSHNTDGIDLVGTNCLVQNCDISTGDDNIAIGSSGGGAVASDILVTNCAFGDGHGMTIGSNTAAGVSNLTVINCTFNGTDNGIRLKSDNDRGGVIQNLSYFNLSMTNIADFPILIYSYYNTDGSPNGITTAAAAATNSAPVTSTTPIWRNVLISNITATVASGGEAGMIWGRTELPVTNVTLSRVSITAPLNFNLYNGYGIQFVDSHITLPGSLKTFSLYNAQVTVSNSAPATNVFSMDGLASTNSLDLYNTRAAMGDNTLLGANPITLSSSTLSNSIGVTLPAARVVNFVLGSNNATVAVSGNLALNSALNISTGAGFGPGSYTLFTYTGTLSGNPVIGSKPPGYNCSLETNTPKQVNVTVSTNSAPTITNQPASQVVLAGTNVLFDVGVAGSVPLSYQWWFNTTNRLAGGTNISLTISNVQPADDGNYSVIVTNAAGNATSSVAVLQVFTSAAATLNSLTLSSSNEFGFGLMGVPGFNYAVLASSNLADWQALLTNAAPFTFTDTNVPPFPSRFYRALYLP